MVPLFQLVAKQRGAGHPGPGRQSVEEGLTQQRSNEQGPPQGELRELAVLAQPQPTGKRAHKEQAIPVHHQPM